MGRTKDSVRAKPRETGCPRHARRPRRGDAKFPLAQCIAGILCIALGIACVAAYPLMLFDGLVALGDQPWPLTLGAVLEFAGIACMAYDVAWVVSNKLLPR